MNKNSWNEVLEKNRRLKNKLHKLNKELEEKKILVELFQGGKND